MYSVYAWELANIDVGCMVIIHMHWLTLMHGAWKFLE